MFRKNEARLKLIGMLFRYFLNYFYGKSIWFFGIFACVSHQASTATLVCGEVGTGSALSLGTEQGCFMGSWCSQIRKGRNGGREPSAHQFSQHLPSVTRKVVKNCSGRTVSSNGLLRIFIICIYDLVCRWRSEGRIRGYSLTEPISPLVVVRRTFFLNAIPKNIWSYQTSSFMT